MQAKELKIMSLLEVRNVRKVYTTRFGGAKVEALNDVTFSVEEGEYVAIMGESGSGKTTLLNILASLDKASGGQVLLGGRDIAQIKQKELCAFRRDNLGFVFQDFNLLDTLSQEDNIYLPLVLAGHPYEEMEERLKLFAQINREGQTILMVTHSLQAASHARRILFIKDGCVFHQIYRGGRSDEEMYRMISDALTVLQAGGGENA